MNLECLNPYKILNHIDRVNGMLQDNTTFPIAVEIDLTNVCNHNCIWCMFDSFRKRVPESLKTDLVMKLKEDLKAYGVKAVTFVGGGEPLVHKDFSMICEEYLKDFDVGVVTNGELINKHIEVLKKCKFVRISLDAGTSRTHKRLHRSVGESYRKIMNNIRSLRTSTELIIGVAFLVHPENYYEIPDLATFLSAMGVNYLQVRPVYMKGLKFNEKMLADLEVILNEAENNVKDTNMAFITFRNRFSEFNGNDFRPTSCKAHSLLSIIGADSTLYLCCQLRGNSKFALGDLKEKSFMDIWKSKERQDVIEMIDIKRCPPCRYKKYNEIMQYLSSERGHNNFL